MFASTSPGGGKCRLVAERRVADTGGLSGTWVAFGCEKAYAAGGWRPLAPTPPGSGPSGLRRGTLGCGRLVIIPVELAWPLLQLLANSHG